MKINLKNSLLFFAGFFIFEFIAIKLFGDIGFYSFWAFSIGCFLGLWYGAIKGYEDGHQKGRIEIEEMIECQHSEKKFNKLLNKLMENKNQQLKTKQEYQPETDEELMLEDMEK